MLQNSDGDGIPDHMDKCLSLSGPLSINGCPVEQIKEGIDYFKKAINEGYVNVCYSFDSRKPFDFALRSAANFTERNLGVSVEIKGYVDKLGPEDYNMRLSEKRANAVYDLLVSSGVDAARLSFKRYGEDISVSKVSASVGQIASQASFETR
jgi:OOP family OmpA-OmpF porin